MFKKKQTFHDLLREYCLPKTSEWLVLATKKASSPNTNLLFAGRKSFEKPQQAVTSRSLEGEVCRFSKGATSCLA